MNRDTNTGIGTDMDTRTGTPEEAAARTGSLFYLLQISDPLLPIGGFTQSYGLETYVQKGIVHNAGSAQEYLSGYLRNNFLYNDLLAVRLAWEYTGAGDLERVAALDKTIGAAKTPREIRTAGIKLGARFAIIVDTVLKDNPFFNSFRKKIKDEGCDGHYCVLYGLATKLLAIDKTPALSAFTYAAAAQIINNCAKLVPISQQDGQRILFNAQGLFQELLSTVETLTEDDLGVSCTGFDLRSMQHERLYTRLYIS